MKQVTYDVFVTDRYVMVNAEDSEMGTAIPTAELASHMMEIAEHHKALGEEAIFRVDLGED